ncbi:tetratricopeptide repeat protein [uncultured Roseobacter sp.]|uniref:tetratricopeptide repeat protein n=1 Tax=uncultured Roseobacter sp. TaxID=114847 RepID=UPI00260920D7|nr:tetratricopeptide repeat protein [uncultured Roseobacter sp.]
MLTFVLAVMAAPVLADCPAPEDVTDALEDLFTKAREAENDQAGGALSAAMWELWLSAPDAAAQDVLDAGMRKRQVADYTGAIDDFTRLIDYCPAYAEGFNQRAFVYFLSGDFDAALRDLDIALQLQPRHVGAQSGRALTLMNLGRTDAARAQLRAALANNPWLSERFLLADGGPLALPGEDI